MTAADFTPTMMTCGAFDIAFSLGHEYGDRLRSVVVRKFSSTIV